MGAPTLRDGRGGDMAVVGGACRGKGGAGGSSNGGSILKRLSLTGPRRWLIALAGGAPRVRATKARAAFCCATFKTITCNVEKNSKFNHFSALHRIQYKILILG